MTDKKNGKDKFYKRPKPKIIQGGKPPSITYEDMEKKAKAGKSLSKAETDAFMKDDLEKMNKELRKKVALIDKKKKVTNISTRKAKQLAGLIPKDLSKKAIIARIAAGTIGGWAGLLYGGYELSKYAEKKLKKIRQEKGTKHLGLKKKKQYGGPVRKAKYKDI